jgi:FlaA1/EpsC-like NDP-sugar epimerase
VIDQDPVNDCWCGSGSAALDLGAALLGRTCAGTHSPDARRSLSGKRVLVTGAAGSIGSELALQLHQLGADVCVLDHDESRLHALQLELTGNGLLDDPGVVLADIRDDGRVRQVMRQIRPQFVFHAAAHKHLPLLERFPSEGVKTNVAGTANLVHAAVEQGVERFILVSTDKAADPSSVLGATKRLAEQIVSASSGLGTRFGSVRFGNVLASRGSLVDTIRHQVINGLTVSITDPEVERYFMTIPEAVGLVIEASLMADRGETFVLDMGEPVKIIDVVRRFAAMVGRPEPKIRFVGLRAGEKLSEDLFSRHERRHPTPNPMIWRTDAPAGSPDLERLLAGLIAAAEAVDDDLVRASLPMMRDRPAEQERAAEFAAA